MKLNKRVIVFILISITVYLIFSCESQLEFYGIADFARVSKIDSHVHINADNTAFIEQARQDNFKLLTINVDYPDFPTVERQQQISAEYSREYPDILVYASTFLMAEWDEDDWQEKTITYIDNTFKDGAKAVKVWKNIGMDFRNSEGQLVMIDDPQFDPIFGHLIEKNIPLIGHLGEPKNCWLPIEEMTVNNDKEYFKNHPQYHMYLHPEMPSYEDQMAARDRMLDKNQKLKFIGAHMASLEWSVDELGKFLDKYPNAVVDIAARSGQIQYQSSQDREKVRHFFIKYQDRILYATDMTQTPEADQTVFKTEVHEKWLTDWKYFITNSTLTVPELNEPFKGLNLPRKVIDKLYRINAVKTFSNAWSTE
jgi:hypothetical protein